MRKILCIGEALIDMICTDKGNTLAAGENFLKKPGGAPTNVAAAIAALGGQVALAAKVGNDPFGHQLINVMKGFGVDVTYMLKDENYFTTLAFVSLMQDGERDFVFSRGADGQLHQSDIEQINLEDTSIVHFGSATGFLPGPLQSSYLHLLHTAKQKNIFISFDPNYRHLLFKNNTASFIQQSNYFIQQCNFFKVSDEEALLLTGAATVKAAAQHFFDTTTATFAITLGKDGTMLGINNSLIIIPSIAIQPIDTTGAGDAFVGAVLYQLSQAMNNNMETNTQQSWQKIVVNANKAGARTCEYVGAMEAFKHLTNTIFN